VVKKANFSQIKEKVAREGVTRRVFSGEKSMMVLNTIKAFAKPALHQHPHEQITYILAGECDFTLGEDLVRLGPGDVILVPPDVPHTLTPLGQETIINLDVFTPIRDDYL
jgi:quercetin dioxygenase-like cupin family protein